MQGERVCVRTLSAWREASVVRRIHLFTGEQRMNTNGVFSRKEDCWETPQWLFDELNEKYHFDLDVCATPKNAKCERFFTQEQDGLAQEWTGNVWCNPPYGRQIGKWVKKAYESKAHIVVMLLPARTDTGWFHDYCLQGGYKCPSFVDGYGL